MRLWSLHPSYLDTKALVAVWREGLLARAVLRGATRGYRHHPQLVRFRDSTAPVSAINSYLRAVAQEADRRGYTFDTSKIGPVRRQGQIFVTRGQLAFELAHLRVRAHPVFKIRRGKIEPWEKGAGA
jgi:hypothetical protein